MRPINVHVRNFYISVHCTIYWNTSSFQLIAQKTFFRPHPVTKSFIVNRNLIYSTMDDGQKSDISMPATVVISDQSMQTQPTVIETKLTVEYRDLTVKLESNISVGKYEDLFLASKSAEPFLQCLNKLQSEVRKWIFGTLCHGMWMYF